MWVVVRPGCALVLAAIAAGFGLAGCSGAAPSNDVPSATKVLVALPLKVRANALAELAYSVADQRDTEFRHFRTIPEIGGAYGAPQAEIAADEKVLAHDGLQLEPDPTHGALWGSVTAAQAKRYFGTTLINSGGTIASDGPPHVPSGLSGVTGVVGLDGSNSIPSAVGGGEAKPACPAQMPSRSSVSHLFGFDKLISRGATGASTSVDILAVHSFQPAVFSNFNRCTSSHLTPSAITHSVVPDTPNTGGGPEVALDSLVIVLLAPHAQVHITRFDPVTPLAFPLMHMLTLGSTPNVLDITVDYCENKVTPTELALSEWLLAAFSASGTTIAAAAGDKGSSGCYPSKGPAVTYPASSAFTVAIGGASYRGSAEAPDDLAVWNDPGSAGGGGDISRAIKAPPWQGGGKRRVPDVSAYAVPGGVGSIPVCAGPTDCVWTAVGGTSLGATVMGATGAMLEQISGAHGVAGRWGDIAAALWRGRDEPAAIFDVVHGSNETFSGACCRAKVGYDTASGWGLLVPDSLRRVVPTHAG